MIVSIVPKMLNNTSKKMRIRGEMPSAAKLKTGTSSGLWRWPSVFEELGFRPVLMVRMAVIPSSWYTAELL